jgi:hypothetical protein
MLAPSTAEGALSHQNAVQRGRARYTSIRLHHQVANGLTETTPARRRLRENQRLRFQDGMRLICANIGRLPSRLHHARLRGWHALASPSLGVSAPSRDLRRTFMCSRIFTVPAQQHLVFLR